MANEAMVREAMGPEWLWGLRGRCCALRAGALSNTVSRHTLPCLPVYKLFLAATSLMSAWHFRHVTLNHNALTLALVPPLIYAASSSASGVISDGARG